MQSSLTHLKPAAQAFVTVKTVAARYGISKSTLYELIKSEPDFPYRNVGLKKKLMIDAAEFEAWIEERTEKQKDAHFNLPTAARLLERYRK